MQQTRKVCHPNGATIVRTVSTTFHNSNHDDQELVLSLPPDPE